MIAFIWLKKPNQAPHWYHFWTFHLLYNTPVQFIIYGLLTQGQSRTNKVPFVYYAKELRGLVNSLKSALMNLIDWLLWQVFIHNNTLWTRPSFTKHLVMFVRHSLIFKFRRGNLSICVLVYCCNIAKYDLGT